jgi:hypothetical protein
MPKSVQSHSSNIYQYQPGRSVSPPLPHPQITHGDPAIAPESSIASAPVGARFGAHNAASGVENAPPQRTPDGRIGESFAHARLHRQSTHHQDHAVSATASPRAGSSTPGKQPALPVEQGALPQQSTKNLNLEPRPETERSLRDVRQDKDRSASDRIASRQPASVNAGARSRTTSRNSARSQSPPADTSRTVPVQVWVRPLVKQELSRLAAQDGLSLSATGAAFLERALQQNIDLAYGALLTPIIESAIARQMRGIATRLSWLLVRIAFDSGQTRSLATNILGRQTGMNQDILRTILAESGKAAKANITRRTPQISELIESVEQWIKKDNGGDQTQ